MDYPGDPRGGSPVHSWSADNGKTAWKRATTASGQMWHRQVTALHRPCLSPDSHPGSAAVPGKKKMESAFGVRGGVIADVWVIAGFCLKGGGGKGRDSGGKEMFIKL